MQMTPQKTHFIYTLMGSKIFFKLLKHPIYMFVRRKWFDAKAQCLSKQMTKNPFLLQLPKVTQWVHPPFREISIQVLSNGDQH
jgi:hypothetical protein